LGKTSKGKLELFEADLMVQGSFARAMQDCQIVIHTASPFQIQVKNPQKELVDPALEGTRNVLQSVNEIESVKRVVFTSSVVAMIGDAREIEDTQDGIFNEDSWNLYSDLDYQPYRYAKTLSEKEAWRINQEQDRWDMISINPAFVLGPTLSGRIDNYSTDFMLGMINGRNRRGLPKLTLGMVDVRDVAQAHVQSAILEGARGRYIICAETLRLIDLITNIKISYGRKYSLPRRQLPDWMLYLFGPLQGFSWRFLRKNLGYSYEIDNTRSVEELGLVYHDLVVTVKDQIRGLEEKGLI
ncbi:MAG: NAD-dependent epimerase/dehydratase family protein, partial [Bacteroidota bacterium]